MQHCFLTQMVQILLLTPLPIFFPPKQFIIANFPFTMYMRHGCPLVEDSGTVAMNFFLFFSRGKKTKRLKVQMLWSTGIVFKEMLRLPYRGGKHQMYNCSVSFKTWSQGKDHPLNLEEDDREVKNLTFFLNMKIQNQERTLV